ncbi:MAG: DUF711 family protein [Chloroflexi bacterium]|nr:DUF711 family protein [Chloroflexota bacterium]
MRIRSITCLYHPASAVRLESLQKLAEDAQTRFERAGFALQTRRLATVPFPLLLEKLEADAAIALAQRLEAAAQQGGFDFLSLGPALPDLPQSYALVPPMLAATQNVFLSGTMTTPTEGIHLQAVQACANVIAQAAKISADGFGNLRFSALAGVAPFGPFFPSSYSQGEEPAFALALEAASVAVESFSGAGSVAEGRQRLLQRLESDTKELAAIAQQLAQTHGIRFAGIDCSLAPYPEEFISLGRAIEALGAPQVGQMGSLAAAAILAETLDRGSWPRTGFNGLMMPVLEDTTLAKRSAQGSFNLKDLLLFSAVCGTGLDTVPLPGDATPAQLTAVLLDVASLAVRLHKPLTARLMPIPGKKAGESTQFDFDYFANGGILDLPAQPLSGPLAGNETYPIGSYHSYHP